MSEKIPLVNLNRQHEYLKEEIKSRINEIFGKSKFIGGEYLKKFEEDFARYCNRKYCVCISNGTIALYLALKFSGIKKGDEVITVPNTFIATAEAISFLGAKPIFVDIDDKTYNIDIKKIEEKITKKTKAIVPVHLYGQSCDMDKIIKLAKKYNLKIIEDCAQAHGSRYKDRLVPINEIGVFSFFPGKNLGAIGDGGAVVTDNSELYKKIKKYINHGRDKKYEHDTIGFNFRFDNLKAAIIGLKLNHLKKWNEQKQEISKIYNRELSKIKGVIIPMKLNEIYHVYHLYVIRVDKNIRDDLIDFLKENDIECGVHYPIPLHLQKAYNHLNLIEGSYPVSEKISKEIISIPIFPMMRLDEQKKVISIINRFFNQ